MQGLTAFHGYPYLWYGESVVEDPASALMGFRWSFEQEGHAGAPAKGSMFLQSPGTSELELESVGPGYGVGVMLGRLPLYAVELRYASAVSSVDNVVQIAGAVSSGIQQAAATVDPYALTSGPAAAWDMILDLTTSSSGSPLAPIPSAGRPAPKSGEPIGTNAPAYVWIPLALPTNAVSLSFDFTLQGDGKDDRFTAALNGTNVLSLETSLVETNVTLNSGLIDVSPWAGQSVELFLGVVGGTSTNATGTVNGIRFYSVAPPTLQAQISGGRVVITWPLSAGGYVLESAPTLTSPTWETVTNAPSISVGGYVFTNSWSGQSRFFRLQAR